MFDILAKCLLIYFNVVGSEDDENKDMLFKKKDQLYFLIVLNQFKEF